MNASSPVEYISSWVKKFAGSLETFLSSKASAGRSYTVRAKHIWIGRADADELMSVETGNDLVATDLLLQKLPRSSAITLLVVGIDGWSLFKHIRARWFDHWKKQKDHKFEIVFKLGRGFSRAFTPEELTLEDDKVHTDVGMLLMLNRKVLYEQQVTEWQIQRI